MGSKKVGNRTMMFQNQPSIVGWGTVVGDMEGKGPQRDYFDIILEEDTFGEKTWEKAESKMLKTAVEQALQVAGKSPEDVDAMLCGDLLNQIMSSSFMARDMRIPFIGLYGACSTMTESLLLGSILVDGGYCDTVVTGASSHFATAERQFRMPLEHGNQRPPSAQWTATAAGIFVVSSVFQPQSKVVVTHGTVGKVIDSGMKDVNQMGAAMAPAALDTMMTHLKDLDRKPEDYDLILTGDLGDVGKRIILDQTKKQFGLNLEHIYEDCGVMMYSKSQDVHAGGSGCGCSAAVIAGRIIREMMQENINRVMLISTGALISTISQQQGESIPGVAHAVTIEVAGERRSF